ncbi:oligoendopeptidase f [hydrocarbon metagenome]|uniref:Oligoendopeptidase f n=1 Tax=hydrocarbon metagenome TaxID=938273 RepID=A0A0W8E3S8_9ZZZZ
MDHPCKAIQELIPLYLKYEISQESRQIVEEHISECEECSRFLDECDPDTCELSPWEERLTKAATIEGPVKRQKSNLVYYITTIILMAAVIGIISYQMGLKHRTDLISAKDAYGALESKGLELSQKFESSDPDLAIAGVLPIVYQVADSKDSILIYVFDSVGERRGVNENIGTIGPLVYRPARNLLLAYQITIPETREEYESIKPALETRLEKYNNTVLVDLNQGQTVVLAGDSDNWQGEITISYYQYWYMNEKDVTCLDSYAWEKGFLRYTGTDPELANFSYEVSPNVGGWGRSGNITSYHGREIKFNEEGHGAFIPDIYHIRMRWNSQEEEFDLTVR